MSETTTPSTTTTAAVRLVGGPDDWHGQVLTHVSAAELAGPREALGGYLVSDCVPADHPDPGARAVYEPDPEPASATIWCFRGWVPSWSGDSELRRADHHQAVDVTLDGDQLPIAWATGDGGRRRVDRILAHWPATGEDDLGFDVWQVRSGDGDWELRHHLGDRWEAGLLPAIEHQEHDDLG